MSAEQKNPDCIFCKIIAGELPSDIVYRDEKVVGFWPERRHDFRGSSSTRARYRTGLRSSSSARRQWTSAVMSLAWA